MNINHPIDLHNLGMEHTLNVMTAEETNNDICLICHENFNNEPNNPKYKIECGHKYHTACIVTWFRAGNSRCPYCNDNGVNDKRVNNIEPPGRFRRSRYFSDSPPNFNKVIAFSRRKDAPPGLIKMVEKLRELEKVSEDKKKELDEFKSIKTHELSFIDMKNKYYKLKDQYYNTIRKIRKQKNNISEYPVIKLIIPKFKVVEITNT
jgi:hypothetical protein